MVVRAVYGFLFFFVIFFVGIFNMVLWAFRRLWVFIAAKIASR